MQKNNYNPPAYCPPHPPALDACEDLLPWDKAERDRAAAKAKEQLKEERHRQKKESRVGGGLLSTLGGLAKDVAHHGEKATRAAYQLAERKYYESCDSRAVNRFRSWLQMPDSERLWCEHTGSIVSGNQSFHGSLFVSSHFVAFGAAPPPPQSASSLTGAVVPLHTVVSIQKAIARLNVNKAVPPVFELVPAGVKASVPEDALLVFSSDGRVHQFFGFGKNFDVFYNVLDHAWRQALKNVGLPPPNVVQSRPPPLSSAVSASAPPAVDGILYPDPEPSAPPLSNAEYEASATATYSFQ